MRVNRWRQFLASTVQARPRRASESMYDGRLLFTNLNVDGFTWNWQLATHWPCRPDASPDGRGPSPKSRGSLQNSRADAWPRGARKTCQNRSAPYQSKNVSFLTYNLRTIERSKGNGKKRPYATPREALRFSRRAGFEPNGQSTLEARMLALQPLTTIPQSGDPNVVLHFYDSAD